MLASLKWKWSASIVLLSLAVGCANRQSDPTRTNAGSQDAEARRILQGDPDALKPRDDFEKSGDPKINADTYFAAGQLAETKNMFSDAIEKYHAALRADPKCAKAMYRLGVVYAAQKQFNDAIKTWQDYVKLTNNAPQAYASLGFCYELSGHPAEAEDAYQKGISKDPKNVACRINYGLMLARQGKLPQGRVQLQTVLTKAEVHYNLGSILQMQGKTEQAKQEFQEALKADPNLKDAKTRLTEMGDPASTAESKAE